MAILGLPAFWYAVSAICSWLARIWMDVRHRLMGDSPHSPLVDGARTCSTSDAGMSGYPRIVYVGVPRVTSSDTLSLSSRNSSSSSPPLVRLMSANPFP